MTHRSSTAGFTLVELGIVLAVIGVLMGSGLLAFNAYLDNARYNKTLERQQTIARALAIYVQENGFLPCPADPSLVTLTGEARGSCSSNADTQGTGIVPYQTINLNQDDARDGYGTFMTYAVSPVVASSSVQGAASVNGLCRTPAWYILGFAVNANPRKARFCCAGWQPVNTDLVIRDRSGGTVISPTRANSNYDLVDVSLAGWPGGDDTSQTAAFVLVSYGKNRFGSFAANGTINRIVAQAPLVLGANEQANINGDTTYIAAPINENVDGTNGYYDDIVTWKTQDQLVGMFGNDSCARP